MLIIESDAIALKFIVQALASRIQLMNEDDGEFQQLSDQLLMYSFSSEISSLPTRITPKDRPTFSEKPKLQLMSSQKPEENSPFRRKKNAIVQTGKVIKIGQATFKSNFQSGNLAGVQQIGSSTYSLTLDKQANSNRTSAWFYWKCEGIKGEATFIIRGFTKSSSLYNEGMKICYRELKDNGHWKRGGHKIVYDQTEDQERHQYELRFSFTFRKAANSSVQFAYCFPYSYTHLLTFLKTLPTTTTWDSLGKSFDGRDIPMLTMGNKDSSEAIVFSARVHPGETVSSFIMEGLIRELHENSQLIKMLKSKYLIRIVPMINPDGVARGNYRFSAAGCDLNRKWKTCKESHQPQIFYLKNMIKVLNRKKKVAMYIDIHGHSRKKSVFFYGCYNNENSNSKKFPFLMGKLHPGYNFHNCSFAIQKDKEGTARICMWNELKIDYVYTLQASFCGAATGTNFLENDYIKIGRKLGEGVGIQFFQLDSETEKKSKLADEIIKMQQQVKEELEGDPELLKVGMDPDAGSESEPQIGAIPNIDEKISRGKTTENCNTFRLTFDQNDSKLSPKFNLRTTKNVERMKVNTEEIKKQGRSKPIITIEKSFQGKKFMSEERDIKTAINLNSEHFSLLAEELYKKNERVHGNKNNRIVFERLKHRLRFVSEEQSAYEILDNGEKQEESAKRNLMHDREGAQYRRVRKLAEEINRKNHTFTDNLMPTPIVKGLSTVNNVLNLERKKSKTIAPSFYPQSQKNRRNSIDIYRKQMRFDMNERKLSINGGDLNVKCVGNKIYQ